MTALTRSQKALIGAAFPALLAVMAVGFTSSFFTLYYAAAARDWHAAWGLPLGVDGAILVFVLLDQVVTSLGARSRWLHLVAWACAAFTVWANAAFAGGSGRWRILHAAMPALWVAGVEAFRFVWRVLRKKAAPAPEGIPFIRWVLAPFHTARLWRRMRLQNVTSYPVAVARFEAWLTAKGLAPAAFPDGLPPLLAHHLRYGTVPPSVAAACEASAAGGDAGVAEAVQAWIHGERTATDRAARAPQAPAQAPAAPRRPSPAPRRAPARRLSSGGPHLWEVAAEFWYRNPDASQRDAMAATGLPQSTVEKGKRKVREGWQPDGAEPVPFPSNVTQIAR